MRDWARGGEGANLWPTRVAGAGSLLPSLRLLLRRVERFARHRARTTEETRWEALLADSLEAALADALETPGVRANLAVADRRAQVSARTPRIESPAQGESGVSA
jgi:hypothetical protein